MHPLSGPSLAVVVMTEVQILSPASLAGAERHTRAKCPFLLHNLQLTLAAGHCAELARCLSEPHLKHDLWAEWAEEAAGRERCFSFPWCVLICTARTGASL